LQAIMFGAQGIASGYQDLVVGAGVESMSRYRRLASAPQLDAGNTRLAETHPMVSQGVAADLIATLEGFTRQEVDEFAARSQGLAAVAEQEGRFHRSLLPVLNSDGSFVLDHDEHPRPGTTVAALSKLEPAFAQGAADTSAGQSAAQLCRQVYPQVGDLNYVHHAGNSSGVVDGASAVLLASKEYARAHGLQPRARVVSMAVAGSEPLIMLTAPGPAAERCLAKAGLSVADIDLWEINEAFAAVALKVIRDLDLDLDLVNVNGGAIALGHPIGASGPMLVQTVLDELERRDQTLGLVTMCTAGGMANALIIERI
jgi:acetyl-CoA C-acetyltransferase